MHICPVCQYGCKHAPFVLLSHPFRGSAIPALIFQLCLLALQTVPVEDSPIPCPSHTSALNFKFDCFYLVWHHCASTATSMSCAAAAIVVVLCFCVLSCVLNRVPSSAVGALLDVVQVICRTPSTPELMLRGVLPRNKTDRKHALKYTQWNMTIQTYYSHESSCNLILCRCSMIYNNRKASAGSSKIRGFSTKPVNIIKCKSLDSHNHLFSYSFRVLAHNPECVFSCITRSPKFFKSGHLNPVMQHFDWA